MGPIKTREIKKLAFIKWTQEVFQNQPAFEEHRTELNLQLNKSGILEYHECIQGDYPIPIPQGIMMEKIIKGVYIQTLNGEYTVL